ncbi:MAG: sulfotransferase [Rhizobiaceae bacterium]|nr:sulfotransferase [Rhizobiaceae bacterium]
MNTADRFAIVTGTMRSGTSLLGHLLQKRADGRRAHSDLAFDNDESQLVANGFAAFRKEADPPVGYGDPFRRLELTPSMIHAFYGEAAAPTEADSYARFRHDLEADILRLAPAGPPPLVFGMKRTSMNYELDLMRALYPDLRLIFTVRDPRDVFLSHSKRVQSDQDNGYSLLIISYIIANFRMLERLAAENTPHLVVRYEDLVADTETAMRQVIDFIGLDAAGYDFAEVTSNDIPSNSSFNEKAGADFLAGQGINLGSVGRYRGAVNPNVLSMIETLCGDCLAKYGYEPGAAAGWNESFDLYLESLKQMCMTTKISFEPVAQRVAVLKGA